MLAFFDSLLQRELTGHIANDDDDDDENSDGSLLIYLIVFVLDSFIFSLNR